MKNKYTNLSDYTNDGLFLCYMKDGKMYPTALKEEQANLLDISLAIPFKDEPVIVDYKHELILKEF